MRRFTDSETEELWACVVRGFVAVLIRLFLLAVAVAVGFALLVSSAKYLGWCP